MKIAIRNLTSDEREHVREVVSYALQTWPNAHLGDTSPREDLRSAFKMIRDRVMAGRGFYEAVAAVERSAYDHADM